MKWAREARSMAQANESIGADDEARKQYFIAMALAGWAKDAKSGPDEFTSVFFRKNDAEQI